MCPCGVSTKQFPFSSISPSLCNRLYTGFGVTVLLATLFSVAVSRSVSSGCFMMLRAGVTGISLLAVRAVLGTKLVPSRSSLRFAAKCGPFQPFGGSSRRYDRCSSGRAPSVTMLGWFKTSYHHGAIDLFCAKPRQDSLGGVRCCPKELKVFVIRK
jgi:hypothetical protein